MGVINEVIFKIEFPKLTLSIFYLIAFGRVLNSMHFGDSLNSNVLKNFAESANIAEMPNIADFFWQNIFGDILPPEAYFKRFFLIIKLKE